MARYVDGFVIPVPTDRLPEYRRMARKVGRFFREHGALEVVECVADDVPVGKLTSFPRSVKLKEGETVVFAWITYRSRRQRDTVNARVFADPRMQRMMNPDRPMPLDGRRMIFGGFRTMVEL